MKLGELLKPWDLSAVQDVEITGLQNDSRLVRGGDVFIAYPGSAADGRLFVQQAIDAGAAAIVYDPIGIPRSVTLPKSIPCIPINNLGHSLATLANLFYNFPSREIQVTGVTGTNGKTTIAYQLAQAYELLGQKSAYIGTIGQGRVLNLKPLTNTTPDAIHLQHLLHDYRNKAVKQVCMEVSSHALDQKRVEGIEFIQAIFTNLSHEHLDYHHTMEAYAAAKAGLFSWPSLQTAVVNSDDEYASFMVSSLPKECKKLTYGLNLGCDVRGANIELSMKGSQFTVESPWGTLQVRSRILGTFNVYNTLAILSSLLVRGFAATEVVEMLQKLQAAPGRMEVVAQEPCVIVDYAHTPDALKNVLSALLKLKKGRLIVVFGCGGDRDKTKRPMMGQIAGEYGDIIIITNDNPRTEDPEHIMREIEQGLPKNVTALKIKDREQAIKKAISLANSQDIILIAGKGHEAYQQIGHEKFVFSDQDVVNKLLNTTFI